jgi:hypothetical protein
MAIGVKSNGRGGASGVFGGGSFRLECVPVGFDLASDAGTGGAGQKISVHSAGNSNAGGGYQLLVRSGVRNLTFAPGYYLDSDMALLHPSCDATALLETKYPDQLIRKAGTVSDATFLHAPADGAIGVDTTAVLPMMRVGGLWKYLPAIQTRQTYTATNVTNDRTYDANATTSSAR